MTMMSPRSRFERIARIRIWILVLTLVPALVSMALGAIRPAAGLAAGGIIILLNLMGTQGAVTHLLEGEGLERIAAVFVWFFKFGLTAAAILALLHMEAVNPLALLAGLAALPVSLVFDIFLFPVNKGEAKSP